MSETSPGDPMPALRFFRAILRDEPPPAPMGIDWKRVAWLAHHHGMAPRALRLLGPGGAGCPDAPLDSLLRGHLRAQKMHLLAESLLPPWIDELRARGMPVALLKGWGLALRFYGFPGDRDFCDFDLLFPADRREEVLRFFLGQGLVELAGTARWNANASKVELVAPRNPDVTVECHFGLGYGAYKLKGFWEGISRSRIELPGRPGATWELPHLSLEDEWLYLLYHAGVQHRFQKLFWLMDLACMADRYPGLLRPDGALARRAGRHGLGPALELAVDLVGRIRGGDERSAFRGRGGRVFTRIILGRYEESRLARASLRARLQGGWIPLAGYGIRRALAQARLG